MDLLTVAETADLLKMSQVTIRRHIASGRLAAMHVGRSIRISRDAVAEFVSPIAPSNPPSTTAPATEKPFTFDSPLWNIVGIIEGGPPDIAEQHDRYLADAYADTHEHE